MKISKADLEKLYHKKLNKDVCMELGISLPTLLLMLKRNGIALKGPGNRILRRKIEVI